MKIIRFGQACDVEVDMTAGSYGDFRLGIQWRNADGDINAIEVDDIASAFRTLYDLYMDDNDVRIPAKVVLEFAMMAVGRKQSDIGNKISYTPTLEAVR